MTRPFCGSLKSLRARSSTLAACAALVAALGAALPASAQTRDPVASSYLVRATGAGFPAQFAVLVKAMGGKVTFAHEATGIAAVSGLDDAGAAQIAQLSGIAAVVDDDYTALPDPLGHSVDAGESGVLSPGNPAAAFFHARQWHMRQIEAPAAWAAGRLGKSTTAVGIIDTGLAYTHADLAGRVDLARSRSFVPADDALVAFYYPGAHPIADLHYHGTHVGSTVASNAFGSAGVTSGVTLVGIKACSVLGSCPTSAVLQSVLYAADLGLPVANMSLGGSFLRKQVSGRGGEGPSFIAIINQVFNYAHRKGTQMVVSAGNAAADLDHDGNGYKAYCSAPGVICVSATGPTAQASPNGPWTDIDALASYSNYGVSSINVAAPGGNGASRVWAACSTFTLITQLAACQAGGFILGLGGTSMAAPHVSGVAALVSEDVGRSPARIKARIEQSADDLGKPGADPAYGKGRLNARKALGL